MPPEEIMITLSWYDVEVVVGVVWAGIGRASATNTALSIQALRLRGELTMRQRRGTKRTGGQRESDAWAYRCAMAAWQARQGHTASQSAGRPAKAG